MSLDEIKEKLARSCRIIAMQKSTEKGRGHQCYLHPDGDKIYGKAIADMITRERSWANTVSPGCNTAVSR